MNKPAYFITGTDTEIGKTTLSSVIIRALVAKGFKTAAMKPVAAGAEVLDGVLHNGDVDALMKAANLALPMALVCPYLLRKPIAPNLSAKQDGRTIDISHIVDCYRKISQQADAVVVEGVGGFLVPFSQDMSSADLAEQLGLPVIMVIGLKLGCINHALLTAEVVRARGLTLAGWIANGIDPAMAFSDGNIATLENWLDAPRLGTLPYLQSFEKAKQYLDLSLLPDWPK